MDFRFDEDQELLKKNLREMVETILVPGYKERAKIDEFNKDGFITGALKKMGLLGIGIPEEYGGQGEEDITAVTEGMIMEELGRGDCAVGLIFSSNRTSARMINTMASEEIKREWLPKLCSGEDHVGCCFTEPSCGTDLSSLAATAVKDGDDYLINGQKSSVSFAFCGAHIVGAKTNPELGNRGISLFLVPTDLPGVEQSVYGDWGLKQLGRGDINYNNVRVPAKNMIGEEGKGFYGMMGIFDLGRPYITMMSIGTATRVMEQAMEYSRQRVVFGKPLCKYEAVSFGFADFATKLEAARLLCYKSFSLFDQGERNAIYSSMAKPFGVDAAFEAVWFSMRVLGHLGYTPDYDASQRLADIAGWAYGDGAWEACKIVVARELGGREFLPYDK
jgi:cyclohexanecarboxyl-CoA dehydrogenase